MRFVAFAVGLALSGMVAIAADILLVSYRPTVLSLAGSVALMSATVLLMGAAVIDGDALRKLRGLFSRKGPEHPQGPA